MNNIEIFNDFKQQLIDLKGKRVRLCFYIPEITKYWGYVGRIREVNEDTKSLTFETDPQEEGDYPITISHLNLEAIVIYAVDQLDEDADLSEKPETKLPRGTLIKSTLINEANQLIKEGWVIYETFAKTVTLLKYPEKGDQE